MISKEQILAKEIRVGVKRIGYQSEDEMLADFMTWARNEHPQLRKFIFHIENEGYSSSALARMKGAQGLAKGKLKGVFDVLCVKGNKMRWAEFKLPKTGVWSPEQKELKSLWGAEGIEICEITCFAQWELFIKTSCSLRKSNSIK